MDDGKVLLTAPSIVANDLVVGVLLLLLLLRLPWSRWRMLVLAAVVACRNGRDNSNGLSHRKDNDSNSHNSHLSTTFVKLACWHLDIEDIIGTIRKKNKRTLAIYLAHK